MFIFIQEIQKIEGAGTLAWIGNHNYASSRVSQDQKYDILDKTDCKQTEAIIKGNHKNDYLDNRSYNSHVEF